MSSKQEDATKDAPKDAPKKVMVQGRDGPVDPKEWGKGSVHILGKWR